MEIVSADESIATCTGCGSRRYCREYKGIWLCLTGAGHCWKHRKAICANHQNKVEAQRDRDMFERDEVDAQAEMYEGDPYVAWGDYELDVWEHTDPIDADLDLWVSYIAEGLDALAFDTNTERRDRDGSLGGFNHAECQTITCRCYLRGWSDGRDDATTANEDRQPQERD